MTRFEINKKGKDEFKLKLAKGFANIIDRGFQVSQEHAQEDIGVLIESGFINVYPKDNNNFEFYYGYTAPHSLYVEFGTRPHWAPPHPIYEWCRRRLQKSGRRLEDTTDTAEYLFGIAFGRIRKRLSAAERTFKAIYKVIGVKGTAPHPFMRPSFEVINNEWPELFKEGYNA